MFKTTGGIRNKTRIYQTREKFDQCWCKLSGDVDYFREMGLITVLVGYQQRFRNGRPYWCRIRQYPA